MKNDLIRRSDAILYSFRATFNNGLEPYDVDVVTVGYINSIPAVDAVEVVHAKWTDASDYVTYKCSNCLHYSSWDIEGKPYHYCPHCGSRMNNDLVYELEE